MKIQAEIFTIVFITIVSIGVFAYGGYCVKRLDIAEKPTGFANVTIQFVSGLRSLITSVMGTKHGPNYEPYIMVLFFYLVFANLAGLLGLNNPTANYSVTLTLSFISWFLFQRAKIKASGWKEFFKSFFQPIFLFLIPNIFGFFAPLFSMSFRLFGNVLSGKLIGTLLYSFTEWLSSLVPVIGQVNFLAPIITPPIHFFFDVFSGLLQAFLFISLTMVFTATEFPEEEQ